MNKNDHSIQSAYDLTSKLEIGIKVDVMLLLRHRVLMSMNDKLSLLVTEHVEGYRNNECLKWEDYTEKFQLCVTPY